MPKRVRVTSAQHRELSNNRTYLVTESGLIVREMEGPELEEEYKFRINPKNRGKQFRILTEKHGSCVMKTFKEIFFESMLSKHGEHILVAPNGKIIKTIRNHEVERPTFKDSLEMIPPPESCPYKCTGFDGWIEGHHHICRYHVPWKRQNQPMPFLKEGLIKEKDYEPGKCPEPEDCPKCRHWARPSGAQAQMHHHECEWFKPYKMIWEKREEKARFDEMVEKEVQRRLLENETSS